MLDELLVTQAAFAGSVAAGASPVSCMGLRGEVIGSQNFGGDARLARMFDQVVGVVISSAKTLRVSGTSR